MIDRTATLDRLAREIVNRRDPERYGVDRIPERYAITQSFLTKIPGGTPGKKQDPGIGDTLKTLTPKFIASTLRQTGPSKLRKQN